MLRISHRSFGSIAVVACAVLAMSYLVFGQDRPRTVSSPQTVIVHLSTGPDDVFAATLALRMAEEALAQDKRVILYLDKRGIRLALPDRTEQLRLGDEDPLWFLLDTLVRRGLRVIVCGESAYIQGLFPSDFMHYALIADSPGTILQRIDRNTVIIKY